LREHPYLENIWAPQAVKEMDEVMLKPAEPRCAVLLSLLVMLLVWLSGCVAFAQQPLLKIEPIVRHEGVDALLLQGCGLLGLA
jgi:hypothetical protein